MLKNRPKEKKHRTPFRVSKLGFVLIQCPASACANVFCIDGKFLYPVTKTAVLTGSHVHLGRPGNRLSCFDYPVQHTRTRTRGVKNGTGAAHFKLDRVFK